MTEETRAKFDLDKFTAQARQATTEIQRAVEDDNVQGPAAIRPALDLLNGFAFALASIADSLQRIANAQEMIAQLTNIDLDATIQEGSKILYNEMKIKEMRGETHFQT